jgi:aminopeptidase N
MEGVCMKRFPGLSVLVFLVFTATAAAGDPPDLSQRLEGFHGDGPAKGLHEHRQRVGRAKLAADSWAPDLGPSRIDVETYDLSLFLDFDRQVASGSVEVALSAAVPNLQTVELDASQGLRILGVVLMSEEGLPYDTPLPLTHRHDGDRLSVDLPRPLADGAAIRLMIIYSGRASENGQGINWHTHGAGSRVAWTMAEPFGARLWWPCNDRPDDKAVVSLQVTAPAQYVAASNGLQAWRIDHDDGTATTRWESAYPVATYLVVLNVSDFVVSETTYTAQDGSTMPVVLYAYPEVAAQAEQDLAFTPELIGVLAESYGEYPFVEEKYGNTTANFGGGMEHQTLTTLGYSAVGSAWMEYLNTHELGHQWWGDWVTCADWRELWLNEGFATLTEWLWAEHRGDTVLQDYLVGADSLGFFFGPVYDNPVPFSGTVYDKGGWVLRMMRHIMGDDDFFAAVRDYRANHAGEAATSWDLLAAFEEQTGEDYDWFFDQWVFGENRPRMTAEWTATSDTSLDLVFDQVQTNAPPFRLPLDLLVTTTAGTEAHRVWLDGDSHVTVTTQSRATWVTFDPDNWVLADIVPASSPLADFGPDFPGPFDAGLTLHGTTSSITVPLTNVGGSALTIADAGMYYDTNDFVLESPTSFPIVLQPGEREDFEISYRGGGMGPDTQWLWMETDVPLSGGFLLAQLRGSAAVFEGPYLQTSARVSLGNVPVGGVGQAVFRVTNMGDQPLTLEAEVEGAGFGYGPTVPPSIAPGSFIEIPLLFTPEVVGDHQGLMNLATNDPLAPLKAIELVGVGTDAARVTVEPPVLDFGIATVDAERTVTIGNAGTVDLAVIDMTVGSGFLATADLPATLAPGEELAVTVRSTGAKAAPAGSQATLRVLTNDPATPWAVVPITAVRTPDELPGGAGLLIAAVASAPGLGGAQWVTDLVLANHGEHPEAVALSMLGDDPSPATDVTVTVPARGQRRVRDVVTRMDRSGVGGLALDVTTENIVATSRTFASEDGATYGQSIPSIPAGDTQTEATSWVLPGLRSGNGFHTNLGLLNPGDTATSVVFEFFAPDGTSLGSMILAAQPRSFVQAVDALRRVTGTPVAGAFAIAEVTTSDASVVMYASVVDDASHDPTYVTPVPADAGAARLVAPSVASTTGFENTRWTSSLDLVNLGGDDVEATLRLHLGGDIRTAGVTVPAGAVWRSDDVVAEVFGTEGSGWLDVEGASPTLVGTGRSFNTAAGGTFGQAVPMVKDAGLHRCTSPVILPGLTRERGFRTNLGFTNPGADDLHLEVTLFDDAGHAIRIMDVSVPAGGFVQKTRVLAEASTSNAWAEIRCVGGGGSYIAQASVIDGTTGDPSWIHGIAY